MPTRTASDPRVSSFRLFSARTWTFRYSRPLFSVRSGSSRAGRRLCASSALALAAGVERVVPLAKAL
jgi:hypothetical protein